MQQEPSTTPDSPARRAELPQAACIPVANQPRLRPEENLSPRFPNNGLTFKTPPAETERGLRRRWQHSLAGIALLLLFGQAPADAATILVRGQCTLVRAIIAANTDTTAGGFCTRGRGPDRVVLPRNRPQVLTRIDNAFFGPTGLPVIRTRITIVGNGNIIARRSRVRFRIFAVARTGRLTLSRLTIRGGFAPRHARGRGGGGVRSVGVFISIDVVFHRNSSDYGSGGGVWAQNVVIIVRNRFSRNRSFCARLLGLPVCPATNGGGLVYVPGPAPATNLLPLPSIAISDSAFSGNIAATSGGGVMVSGEANINNSVFADNAAQEGGALSIANQLSNVEITGCTLTDNVATESGGGIIVGDGSDLTLNNTEVSGNEAPQGREVLAQPGSDVEADNQNEFGFVGEGSGVEGFDPGASDTIPDLPPADPIPEEELPPMAELLPILDPPTDETPTDETPTDETPTDETPTDETPTDETPTDETPTDETPTDETPTGETPTGETPTGETPTGETPTDETPGETPGETPPDQEARADWGARAV